MNGNKKSFAGGGAAWPVIAICLAFFVGCLFGMIAFAPIIARTVLR